MRETTSPCRTSKLTSSSTSRMRSSVSRRPRMRKLLRTLRTANFTASPITTRSSGGLSCVMTVLISHGGRNDRLHENRIKGFGRPREDPLLVFGGQAPQALLRLALNRGERSDVRGEIRAPRDAMTAKHLHQPWEKRLGGRLPRSRFLDRPRRELQINVLERLQAKERGGLLVRLAVRDVGPAQMVEDDPDLRKAFGQARDLRQTRRVRLQADGQSGLRTQLPRGEGARIIERTGIERLGAAAREQPESRHAVFHPASNLGRGVRLQQIDRPDRRQTVRIGRNGVGQVTVVVPVAGRRLDDRRLLDTGRI